MRMLSENINPIHLRIKGMSKVEPFTRPNNYTQIQINRYHVRGGVCDNIRSANDNVADGLSFSNVLRLPVSTPYRSTSGGKVAVEGCHDTSNEGLGAEKRYYRWWVCKNARSYTEKRIGVAGTSTRIRKGKTSASTMVDASTIVSDCSDVRQLLLLVQINEFLHLS